jgi:hypothetical protein
MRTEKMATAIVVVVKKNVRVLTVKDPTGPTSLNSKNVTGQIFDGDDRKGVGMSRLLRIAHDTADRFNNTRAPNAPALT